MIRTLSIARRDHPGLLAAGFTLCYGMIALPVLADYIDWKSANFLIGMAALPLMVPPGSGSARSGRFGWMALCLSGTGLLLPVKTALYLGTGCALIFLWEEHRGRLTALPFLTILMMSPVFQYFAHVFSFPVRLWLTAVAGSVLVKGGLHATVAGNMISCGTGEYAVDPACMGLNMLVTSLLCGLVMIAVYGKQTRKRLSLHWVIAALLVFFLLNIGANLMRILLLVYFRLLPDNPMHGLTGIICLLIYVLLPGSAVISRLVKRLGRPQETMALATGKRQHPHPLMHFLLIPLFICAAWRIQHKAPPASGRTLPLVPGYAVSWYDREVVKMVRPGALIYLKPVQGFIYTDHNPLLCWTGSGYGFDSVQEQRWGGVPLFTGVLSKGKEKLYTAWWYDNGAIRTTGQLQWRWEMIRGGKPFTIINVTAGSKEALKEEVAGIAALKWPGGRP